MSKENYPLIVPETFTPHWRLDLTDDQYHGDTSAVSSGSFRKVLKSPWAFYCAHILRQGSEETDAMRFGSAFHLALLEPDQFQKRFIVEPEFKGTGMRAAKTEWEEAQPKDAMILKRDRYDDLLGMIESVSHHKEASYLLKGSQMEQCGYFRDPDTGVLCRFKSDFFHPGLMALGDVKTTTSCLSDAFSRRIFEHRYDIQMYFYSLGIKLIHGREVDYPMFLAVESKPPYEVALYTADKEMMYKAETDYKRAMATLKACLEADSWTRYQQKNQTISLPKYAFYD